VTSYGAACPGPLLPALEDGNNAAGSLPHRQSQATRSSMNQTVAAVTRRIIARSRPSRERYLARMEAARKRSADAPLRHPCR